METDSLKFLKKLLDTPGPSGFEVAPARVEGADVEFLEVVGNVRHQLGTLLGA